MMPGVGFIGGQLSILGGYSWPGAVDLIETWDEDRSVQYSTMNSTVQYSTVPILLFCPEEESLKLRFFC